MRLADVIRPISVEDFKHRFFGKQCFVVKRKKNPLTELVSLGEIEARLNDGVATAHGLSIIGKDGTKIPAAELRRQQTGPSWVGSFVDKSRVRALLAEGNSFVMHNMSSITPRLEALIRELEASFDHGQADLHVYVSPKKASSGYSVHRDQPQHKLYLQLLGSTQWTVYKGEDPRRAMPVDEAERLLEVDFRATMTPGSVLYMPPGVFHHATNPDGPRVSLSIPFYESPKSQPVDREFIPLTQMFEGS